jgi:GDP-D-mannose dehydratase
MLKWFDAKEEQAFGKALAQFYIERVPFESPFSTKKFAAKTQDTLKKVDLQVQQFKAGRALNVYKKAKLGNAFKWALRDAGYDAEYVDELTEWLMLRF